MKEDIWRRMAQAVQAIFSGTQPSRSGLLLLLSSLAVICLIGAVCWAAFSKARR